MLMRHHSLSLMEAQLAAATVSPLPPPNLPDDICAEILVRLPVKSVLRFRAVCKAWRDITTRPLFHAAHALLQPAKVVLYTNLDSEQPGCVVDIALDVVPVSGEETAEEQRRRRRLIRYPKANAVSSTDPLLLDSCNGVLLFRKDALPGTCYFLCNPVTRQWAELPKITGDDDQQLHDGRTVYDVREYAFYFHQQSGEFRLLCRRRVTPGADAGGWAWCILSTGAAEPRHVDVHVDTRHAADDDDHGDDLLRVDAQTVTRPVALHDSMHWPPRHRLRDSSPSSSCRQETAAATEMVAFDVRSEKFRLMAGPPTGGTRRSVMTMMVKLFVMDGLLVAANFRAEKEDAVELWFLVDYGAGRWERRHQVPIPTPWRSKELPWPGCLWSTAAACDDRGNVMLGDHTGLLVYNVRTKTVVRAVNSVATPGNHVLVSRHVFRENMVEHPNFKRSSCADLPFIHFWC